MGKTTTSNALLGAALAAWLLYALVAAWYPDPRPRGVALGLAGAMTVWSLAAFMRQLAAGSVRHITVAVARAPRDAYWRGYQDRGTDSRPGPIDEDTEQLDRSQLHGTLQ